MSINVSCYYAAHITPWDQRFFDMAKLVASWSEDNSRKVGAVIVGPAKEVRSIGFNGLARGVSNRVSSRFSNLDNEKYFWFEHAERNAIYNAARSGVSTGDCEMFTTLFPCSDCIRAIIQSGITALKTFSPPLDDPYFARSFEVAMEMADEVGLKVQFFDKKIV